jgi:hypothetical protein
MNADADVSSLFSSIFSEYPGWEKLATGKLLLAHYTSVEVLEQILEHNELWFSNPLFMNDLEEMRFGLNEGFRLFMTSKAVDDAAGSTERSRLLRQAFEHYFTTFDANGAFDTYIFCLSEHEQDNADGLLSMWRGYGGYGKGAALVFYTQQLTKRTDSPLLIAPVNYDSTTNRLHKIEVLIEKWASLLKAASVPDDQLYKASHFIFEALKLNALTSKHDGFREEREWRAMYMPDRDVKGIFRSWLGYWMGDKGAEPKLKFKVQPIPDFSEPDLSLEKILAKIILGPTLSTPLAKKSIERMLDTLGHPALKEKLSVSTIPLRQK